MNYDDLVRRLRKPKLELWTIGLQGTMRALVDDGLTILDEAADLIEALQAERDEEHYQAAMRMSEKHRKNWVEACQRAAAAEADAARYRWLRDNAYGTNKSIYFETMIDGDVADIDAAIDAAMKEGK